MLYEYFTSENRIAPKRSTVYLFRYQAIFHREASFNLLYSLQYFGSTSYQVLTTTLYFLRAPSFNDQCCLLRSVQHYYYCGCFDTQNPRTPRSAKYFVVFTSISHQPTFDAQNCWHKFSLTVHRVLHSSSSLVSAVSPERARERERERERQWRWVATTKYYCLNTHTHTDSVIYLINIVGGNTHKPASSNGRFTV